MTQPSPFPLSFLLRDLAQSIAGEVHEGTFEGGVAVADRRALLIAWELNDHADRAEDMERSLRQPRRRGRLRWRLRRARRWIRSLV